MMIEKLFPIKKEVIELERSCSLSSRVFEGALCWLFRFQPVSLPYNEENTLLHHYGFTVNGSLLDLDSFLVYCSSQLYIMYLLLVKVVLFLQFPLDN